VLSARFSVHRLLARISTWSSISPEERSRVVPIVTKSALVPYSAADMYALVNDVPRYPEFLPWCRSTRVLSRDQDEMQATIELAVGAIHKSFTTLNRLQKNKMIEVRLLEGPFRHLEGYWRFEPLGGHSCKVMLDMDFEFSGRLLAVALGPIFSQIVNTLIDSFCKRAQQIYGKR
jgi:ribosome-associated toxin RatA of RatAB toxin-antitoxin module